jgi:ABC-type lipoprotein export system ATPase subunit
LMVTHSREVAQSADRIVRIQAGHLLDEPGQHEVGV